MTIPCWTSKTTNSAVLGEPGVRMPGLEGFTQISWDDRLEIDSSRIFKVVLDQRFEILVVADPFFVFVDKVPKGRSNPFGRNNQIRLIVIDKRIAAVFLRDEIDVFFSVHSVAANTASRSCQNGVRRQLIGQHFS